MKICFVTTGDIESLATMKRATGMAEPLLKNGNKVSIVLLDTKNNRDRIKLEAPNVECLFFKEGNFLSEIRQKNQLIKKWKPDLIYVCAFVTRNFIYGDHLKNVITLVEHSELRSAIADNKRYKKTIDQFLEKFSTNYFDGQIVASRYLEYYYLKIIGNKRLKKPILYSPYAYNKDVLVITNTDKLIKKYDNKKTVLYIGTLSLNYGFLDIIKAVRKLSKTRDDFKLLIVGNGKDKQIGIDYIIENQLEKYIEFLGYVPEEELSFYFSNASSFVSPINDTIQDKARCPSKLFMYLAFKKPIITSKIGEAEALFGENGYYYEPSNINQLTSLINESLDLNNLKYNIDIEKHTWQYRTEEFLNWIKQNFNEN